MSRNLILKTNTMDVNLKSTVTISLETYKEMEDEIKRLRKQVEEQTIYKEILPPIYGYIIAIGAIIFYLKCMPQIFKI